MENEDYEIGLPCPPLDDLTISLVQIIFDLRPEKFFEGVADDKPVMVECRGKELKSLLSMYKRHRKCEEDKKTTQKEPTVQKKSSVEVDKTSYGSKLESTKRKLHSYYQEADKVKREKQIHIIDLMDLPKAPTKPKPKPKVQHAKKFHHDQKVAAIAQH
ncbi:hypothetical protein JCGZ_11941 [Jatropha curcas]|uniref:Uncharacterized protein n=1 Tax=Jatropha curcas TaxID=180498 RepID=A0A067KID8_JATCU|nr:uncharacterized protein LOC105637068 [Jatropha curcas]XP_037496010.1 uncharacterized protein LOC105637068 [Jatropha curcas]XP_037496011.1 uncharacterized protein LOC105637068 [Jatropha curcas]XP_037496012.1 uncharacterized protein LOC105637068 [Jatropha curcas]XP_037496013.1 uncharacterized protein LOC105637068 [Jatropha curcas]XP_037496014.1 uncharacterized protein LOC105637068 [Jatropha curcas]KDP34733.1 hypothetical protein JCGZ_11941 [Jatropha curcas]